jgi:AcrR family transcriptional regulator
MSPRAQAQASAVGEAASPLQLESSEFGRERVGEIQRRRMLAAMVEVAAERGAGNVTVADVVGRSGVSRRTFYEIFEDREDCFLAAFEESIERAAQQVVPAYREQRQWNEGVRAALTQLLGLFEEDTRLGRLLVVEALGAGPRALERRRHVVECLSQAIQEGGRDARTGKRLSPLTAEGVVGAVLSVLHGQLSAPSPRGLLDLVNPLMSIIVLPYQGRAAAERELGRKVAARSVGESNRDGDPLRDLDMRLTYRTVRVLSAVATHPGGSNRVVATAAGVSDQGQISKLLARLHGLGLIENAGGNLTRGEPNAWILTTRGWSVRDAISAPTEPA